MCERINSFLRIIRPNKITVYILYRFNYTKHQLLKNIKNKTLNNMS